MADRRVGFGMTAKIVSELPCDAEDRRRSYENPFREMTADTKRWVEALWADLQPSPGSNFEFKEREDTGWYAQASLAAHAAAENSIEKGDAGFAAYHAARFCELTTELALNLSSGQDALYGVKRRTDSQDAGAKTRKQYHADRVAVFERHRLAGKGIEASKRATAKELKCSVSSVEKSRAKQK